MRTDFDARWEQLAEEVISGIKEWRLQHPKASLREIERALDERLGRMRRGCYRMRRWQAVRRISRRQRRKSGQCALNVVGSWRNGQGLCGSW